MGALPALDHMVINVHEEMDAAEPLFAALGFTLTPRGYHSLGSINHLMMFGTDYLELIGMPKGAENTRPEILASPLGIDGLVFKTADVDRVFAHLQAQQMAGDPPRAFTRPVELPAGEAIARFRTVTVRADVFPAGRVYFCEHGTPELVWRPEWQQHANGARRMAEAVIVSTQPAAAAERYARLLEAGEPKMQDNTYQIAISGAVLSVLSPQQYNDRYGELASSMQDRQSMFGAVVMQTLDFNALTDCIRTMPESVQVVQHDERVMVRVPAFDSVLEFVV